VPFLLGVTDQWPRCLVLKDFWGSQGITLKTLRKLHSDLKVLKVLADATWALHLLHQQNFSFHNLSLDSIVCGARRDHVLGIYLTGFGRCCDLSTISAQEATHRKAMDMTDVLILASGLFDLYCNKDYRHFLQWM